MCVSKNSHTCFFILDGDANEKQNSILCNVIM